MLRWDYTDEQLEKAIKIALQAIGSSQRVETGDVMDVTPFRDLVARRGLTE